MDINSFKKLSFEQKLNEIKYHGNILGPYERYVAEGVPKLPGDIYELHDFWVYLSEDETMVIPTRRNPLVIE